VTDQLAPAEFAWFAALCDDDYEQLGVPNLDLLSSIEHCASIVAAAEAGGFDNILLPSGYLLGIDAVTFAAAMSQRTTTIKLLVAVRMGELWLPQLARQMATLRQMLGERLTINIISSELPGETLPSAPRYQRTLESMHGLRTLLCGNRLVTTGDWLNLDIDPPRITVGGSCPPLYFGGMSADAQAVAAEAADVYLMWPDTMDAVAETISTMRAAAADHGRNLRFGYRVHVVVRETEALARAAADFLLAKLDAATGDAIRAKSLDSQSFGVRQQAELRDAADHDGYIEPNLWTGIGRARSGCGAAIVGDPDQVVAKLNRYRALGIDSFILSGYPHRDECERFGQLVLPKLKRNGL
jgi:alkanesulfonate monooxygenase